MHPSTEGDFFLVTVFLLMNYPNRLLNNFPLQRYFNKNPLRQREGGKTLYLNNIIATGFSVLLFGNPWIHGTHYGSKNLIHPYILVCAQKYRISWRVSIC